MITIVDTCVIASMFNPKDINHPDFSPVLDLLKKKRIKIIYGGTKYKAELARLRSYVGILNELKKIGSVIELSNEAVDAEQVIVETKESDSDFDDPHLVAMTIVGRARVLCTKDTRADRFVRDNKFYVDKVATRPSIYKQASHLHLFNNC